MSTPPEQSNRQRGLGKVRGLIHLSLWRLAFAGLLLAGLFALLFLVLLPGGDDGGDGLVSSARIVDTPAGPSDVSVGVMPGQLARDFEASELEGARVRLSDLRGRPVVVNFWATWCASCSAEMPVLEEQRRAHRADDLAIVAVNVGEGRSTAQQFIEALELFGFRVALDLDIAISDAYGVRGLPQSVFIDRDGVIQAVYRGQLDADTMDRYVRAAIDAVPGGEPPFRLRLIRPVPRQHVVEVVSDEGTAGEVLFLSRRFRCDDAYCGDPIAGGLRELPGVIDIELRNEELPPSLRVTFDPDRLDVDDVIEALTEALRAHPDPLYTQELEVRYSEGAP